MDPYIILANNLTVPPTPPWPPVPTRAEVLSVNMHFRGGLLVPSQQYGLMPWWPTALSWMDSPTDRQTVYAVSRKDTHQIIHIPSGSSLYNEPPPNFYTVNKFGPRDWTNGMTGLDNRFTDLVTEVIQAGFKFIITMDETWPTSYRIMDMVLEILSDKQLQYGFVMPGYDGVFYGWLPQQIAQWFDTARGLREDGYYGMEHQPGRIPVGNGPADWVIGGMMKNCDVLLGEHTDPHSDSTWQVLGRCIRPFIRPSDMPSGDDPNPPFYLVDTVRGPRYYCVFETWYPYSWVRVDPNNPSAVIQDIKEINAENSYLQSMGVKFLG